MQNVLVVGDLAGECFLCDWQRSDSGGVDAN